MDDTIPQDAPLKQCTGICGRFLPAASEYFRVRNGKTISQCRACECKKQRDRYALTHIPKRVNIAPDGYKQCLQCEKIKQATSDHFYQYPNGNCKSPCRACKKKTMDAYAADHRENHREYMKRYHAENRDRDNKRVQAWMGTHRETVNERRRVLRKTTEGDKRRESGRKSYARHRNRNREQSRRYYATHTQAFKVYGARRRATKRNIPGSYTPAQIAEQLKRQRYRCYYAKCSFSKFPRIKEHGRWKYVYDIEHTFPLSRVVGTDIPANDISYLVLACHDCNQSKGKKFPHEWPEGGRLL